MIWIIISILLTLVVIAAFLKNKTRFTDAGYKKQKTLFSPAERSFLGVLNQAIEDNAIIFGKVRVADILTPVSGLPRKKWQVLFNKVSGKHFDFIVCDKQDLSVLCAIELDDKSHNSKVRKARDEFLQSACFSAKLPLIQIPARSAYNIDEIRQSLIVHLSGSNDS
jgi:Protein of unknown function (DUF2726)